ncbi:MAG: FAD:protein FMN transferase, partial [Actinomycetes bacterium]
MSVLDAASFAAWGTTAVLATWPAEVHPAARAVLDEELAAIDRSCSRFRPDSEVTGLNRTPGRWVEVSPLLFEAVEVALRAARQTDGAVDPTVGRAIRLLGYDRDFAELAPDGPPVRLAVAPVPGWQ